MPAFPEQRLPYLYEAVHCGSVRAAAEKLAIAPSAVSRQIALLEEELNVALLERHRKGVVPTQAGQLLIDYTRQQVAHRGDMLSKIESLRGLRSGSVAVVTGEGFVQDLVRNPLRAFREHYPGITVSVEINGTTEILRRISEDEAELGLVYNTPADSRIVMRAACQQPMCAIVGPDHPLRREQHLAFAELTRWPIALMNGSYGIRQLLAHVEYTEKTRLNPVLTTNLISVLKAFVATGQGITLLPRFSISHELAAGELFAVPVRHDILERAEVHLITRAGRHLSPAANQFVSHCLQGMSAFRPGAN
ncbi:Transcriptional regulator, LysR family [plant metagenome]|uniref:Transcriptional regulator, LysR family n=1 Tax=plant metagenome TaxID=1297885 RepID=A0A484QB42_9ZZZZ